MKLTRTLTISVSAIDSYIVIRQKSNDSLEAQEFPKEQVEELDQLIASIDQNLRQIDELGSRCMTHWNPTNLKAFIEKIELKIEKGKPNLNQESTDSQPRPTEYDDLADNNCSSLYE